MGGERDLARSSGRRGLVGSAGRAVGRAGQRDLLPDRQRGFEAPGAPDLGGDHHGVRAGRFGFFEPVDDKQVAHALLSEAVRWVKAKGAHDELIAAAHRAQADALEIEAGAKRRLADEYDAAQERGEIKSVGKPNSSNPEELAGVNDIGLTHKDIHEARLIRDAEVADPGIVRRTLLKARPSQQFPGHVFGAGGCGNSAPCGWSH